MGVAPHSRDRRDGRKEGRITDDALGVHSRQPGGFWHHSPRYRGLRSWQGSGEDQELGFQHVNPKRNDS